MAKKGKKRQRNQQVKPECNITGTADFAAASDSLENCLQELEEETNPLYYVESKQQEETIAAENSNASKEAAFPLLKSSALMRKEKLDTWDAAFQMWSKNNNGQYTSGLLPCFETELARHFQVKELSGFLLKSCSDLKMPAFERWLLDAKLEEKQKARLPSLLPNSSDNKRSKGNNHHHHKHHKHQHQQQTDAVLPQYLSLTSESTKRLMEEIVETGVVEQDQATKILQDLFRRTRAAIQEIASQNLRCANQAPFKTDRIVVEHGSYLVSLLYSRKKWKSPFVVKINSLHYEKLKQRFLQTHHQVISDLDFAQEPSKRNKVQHAFHLLLMVMTLRYSSFSGGQLLESLKGGGMQGGIHEQAFDVLKDTFPKNTLFECFASPFNVTLPYFASAFEEIDWHFGSLGDLASVDGFEDGCCCEANPPFSPGFMEFLAERIDIHIANANANQLALSFVVIVPAVHEQDTSAGDTTTDKNKGRVASAVKRFAAKAHRRMVQSSACRKHIVLLAKEHGYVEGAQHLRPTRYKRSLYDTSVILLQSQKAREMALDVDRFQEDIREAFAERHSDERSKRSTTTPEED